MHEKKKYPVELGDEFAICQLSSQFGKTKLSSRESSLINIGTFQKAKKSLQL